MKVDTEYNLKIVRKFLKKEKLKNGYERIVLNKIRALEENQNQAQQKIDDYLESVHLQAENLFGKILQSYKERRYVGETDGDKISYYKKEFPKFYENFPIICRYMIIHNQYKRRAIYRYLIRSKDPNFAENNHLSSTDRTSIFIELNALFVMFLWEEYNVGIKYSRQDAYKIRQATRKSLEKEFKDFDKLYKSTEKKLEKQSKKHNSELSKELFGRIRSRQQTINDDTKTKNLINLLEKLNIKNKYKNTLNELLARVKEIHPIIVGKGTNEEAQKHHEYELKQEEAKRNFQKIEL